MGDGVDQKPRRRYRDRSLEAYMWATIAAGVATPGFQDGRLSAEEVATRTDNILAEFEKRHPLNDEED